MQPSSFVFEKKSYHEQNIPTFTCVPKPVSDEILEELRPRFTQHKNSVGQQHIAICQQHQQNQHWIHFLGELSFFSLSVYYKTYEVGLSGYGGARIHVCGYLYFIVYVITPPIATLITFFRD